MRDTRFSFRLFMVLLPVAFSDQPAQAEVAAARHEAQQTSVVPKAFVLDGDSITDGYGVTPTYPDHIAEITGSQVINLGVSGRTLAQMAASFDSRGVAALSDDRHRNTLVLLGGINDILHDTATTPETLRRQLLDYARKSQSAGFRLIIVTLLPVEGLTQHREAIRAAHNQWIQTNWHTFADALADAASEPALSDPSDRRHYSDGLHLTAEGLRVLADVVLKAATLPPS